MEYQIELTGSRRTRLWCPIVEAMQMWLEGTWFWICILASRSRANLTLPPKILGHAQVAWQVDSLLPPRITYSAKQKCFTHNRLASLNLPGHMSLFSIHTKPSPSQSQDDELPSFGALLPPPLREAELHHLHILSNLKMKKSQQGGF